MRGRPLPSAWASHAQTVPRVYDPWSLGSQEGCRWGADAACILWAHVCGTLRGSPATHARWEGPRAPGRRLPASPPLPT